MPLRFTDCSAIAAVGLFGDRVWTRFHKIKLRLFIFNFEVN